MRLHTSSSGLVLLCPRAKLTWHSSGRHTSEELPNKSEVSDFDRSGLMCITPSGERDFSARLGAAGAIAADAIDEERVAAVVLGDDAAYLVRGPVALDGEWDSVLRLADIEPKRVTWPAGLIWKKGDKSLYEMADTHGNGIPDAFVPTLETSPHGCAIASVGSGTIVVLRPDSREIDFAVQVPSQEEATIYALPTAKGVLVTLIVDGQDSAFVHIAEDGKILGKRAAQCAGPAIALDAGFVIYDEESGQLELVDDTLKTKAQIEAPFPVIDAAAAADRQSFALADNEKIARGHVDAKGKLVIVDEISYGASAGALSLGAQAALEAKWDPELAHGKPGVGFAAGVSQKPWTAAAGAEFELTLLARSTGGPGRGVSITIAGDALKNCELVSVSADGLKAELSKNENGEYRAEFPKLELVQGIEYPFNPKPKNDAQKHAAQLVLAETHFELVVRGKAGKASGDLLTVCIASLSSDSAPLKWMRPLTIS